VRFQSGFCSSSLCGSWAAGCGFVSRRELGTTRGKNQENSDEPDPLDKLKQRYANDELSDAEFEARLDRLLDADRRAESANYTASDQLEQTREAE
jgi:TATA-binding protein-associated factor Taf7